MEIWPYFDDNLLIDCLIIGRLFCTVGVHPTRCKVDFLYSFGIFTCSGLMEVFVNVTWCFNLGI